VTRVVHFNTFGQEPLAAALTATSERRPAILGFHTRAETELALAGALGSLISAFRHGREVIGKGSRRIAVEGGLSTGPCSYFTNGD